MSGDIEVDLHELERFARYLERHAIELDEGKRHLVQRFALLEETWRDQVFKEFTAEIQCILGSMDNLVAQTHEQAEYLFGKVTALRRFLDIDLATTIDADEPALDHLALPSGEPFDSEETAR